MGDGDEKTAPAVEPGDGRTDDVSAVTGADDIPEMYQIDTVEQLRAMSDRLRVRIAELLSRHAMTVAQLSDELGLAHAKVHYHVREMEQVGLVRLVATREKSGILEKYYRTIARNLSVSPSLLRSMPTDESVATITEFIQQVLNDALRAFSLDLREPREGANGGTLSETTLYLSDEGARALMGQVADLIKPYETQRGVDGERERRFVHLLYTTLPLSGGEEDAGTTATGAAPAIEEPVPPIRSQEAAASATTPPPPWPVRPVRAPAVIRGGNPHRRVVVVAGIVHFSRAELEQAVERNEPISLNVLGHCQFDADIPADLADRAIARFRLRGTLGASPEVRAVLQRKQRQDASKKEGGKEDKTQE